LKLLYAESYVNPNFVKATVSYDAKSFYNSGIGGASKENVYAKKKTILNSILY
jgi:hypothetical protein